MPSRVTRIFMLALMLVLIAAGGASACCTTQWTDTWEPAGGPFYFGPQSPRTLTFSHDLTDDGFVAGRDTIHAYGLSIGLYDDGDCRKEVAWINLPGWSTDTLVEVGYQDVTLGFSLAGLFSLNLTGELRVTIERVCGDFVLAGSRLVACGDSPVHAPLPGSLILLGSGLIGLAGWRKRTGRR